MTPRRVKRRSIHGRGGGGNTLPGSVGRRRDASRMSQRGTVVRNSQRNSAGSLRSAGTRRSTRSRPHSSGSLPQALLDQHTLLHPRHYANTGLFFFPYCFIITFLNKEMFVYVL